MADQTFNIAKGKIGQYFQNVEDGSPANSRIIMIVFNAGDTDDAVRDCDTVAAIEALASTAEVTNTNYARKTIAAADITITVDDTNNRLDIDITDQTWTAVAAGTAWTDICLAYDADNTAGTDANLVPLTWHDFAVTPDGSDITAQINAAGVFRAS
jgi:hypothetical protein